MTMIVAFDLAPRKCGWCAGTGAAIPTAGGWRLDAPLDNLGLLLDQTRRGVAAVFARFAPGRVLYESPILPGGRGRTVMGSLDQRRAQYAQGAFLEWLCLETYGVPCEEADVYQVKAALTGSKKAEKPDMVRAALKLGVVLPETKVDGREDAADAVGAWLVGVRCYATRFLPEWDRRVFQPRGGLL